MYLDSFIFRLFFIDQPRGPLFLAGRSFRLGDRGQIRIELA